MRKLSLYLFPLLAIGVLFTSCKKDPPVEETVAATPSAFYALIGNADWNAEFSYATEVNGRLQIVGSTYNGKVLRFDLDDIQAKKYIVNDKSTSHAFYTDSSKVPGRIYNSKVDGDKYSGTINITSNDPVAKTVSGTFDIILKDTINEQFITVENGTFTVSYLSNMSIDAFSGYSTFFGVYNDAGITQFGLWYRSPVTGQLEAKNIGVMEASNVFNNSLYDSKSKTFYAIGDGLNIRGINVYSGKATADKEFKIICPINIQNINYGVHTPYDTSSRQALVNFSIEAGKVNASIIDSLILPVSEKSSIGYDGVNIYIIPDQTAMYQLLRINLLTKDQTILNYTYKSTGLEYIGNNSFLTVIDTVKPGTEVTKRLLGEININFGQITTQIIGDLADMSAGDGHLSTCFSKKKSTFYATYSSTDLMLTKVSVYNAALKKLDQYSVTTAIEGIKTKE